MTRFVFSRLAEKDLEGIGDFIATDNPERALSFVQELRQRCATITDVPLAYPLREEFGKGVRLAAHRRYLVLYQVARSDVRVERILQGSRNVLALVRSPDNP